MKNTTSGTNANEASAAVVPQPGSNRAIQQQVSLHHFDRLAANLFNSR